MIILLSLAIGVMFGVAAYLMLKRDLIRVITGVILLGNAANLFIMSAGLRRGAAPVLPSNEDLADPLVQAMTLTAIVISFGVAALMLSVVFRVYDSHHSVDVSRLSSAETAQATLDDRDEPDSHLDVGKDGEEAPERESAIAETVEAPL